MNKVQHFEIPADNIDRAQEFYKNIFEWKSVDWPMNDETYHVFDSGIAKNEKNMTIEPGAIDGAVVKRGEEKGVVIFISVKSIDDIVKKAEAQGGRMIGSKLIVKGMGDYARIIDSEGNIIGLWEEEK